MTVAGPSSSVFIHLLRGLVGLAALLAIPALIGSVGAAAFLLAPVTIVAWRGCPTCWAVGLAQTIAGRPRACPAPRR